MLRCAAGRVNTDHLPLRAVVWHHSTMASREDLIDSIAGFTLFADLADPQLAGIVHTFEEAMFAEGERILRQGLTGSGFHVILDGEAAVVIDGTERARLARGDFFGEVSVILGEAPIADVVALRPLRCLVLAGPRVEKFLIDHPRVMWRMLQTQARRLRAANRWRS
jgi:CRP/FNR family transcriptional regulator, cyclic AMP receptor protein